MSLVVAVHNQSDILVAADIPRLDFSPTASQYGRVIALPNRCCVLIAGNLEAVRHAISETALSRYNSKLGAAGVAQLIHAALTLEVVPDLAAITGRVEIIIAGIDPVRHTERPGLYYLDSARGFTLGIVDSGAVAAGATAALDGLLSGVPRNLTTSQLTATVKDAYAATKLCWPEATGAHLLIGTITPDLTRYQVF